MDFIKVCSIRINRREDPVYQVQILKNYIIGCVDLISEEHEESKSPNRRIDKFRVRVLQKNLVYCIGLPAEIAQAQVLRKPEYLGQYGIIDKISVNKNGFTGKGQKGPSFSVYISFKNEIQASLTILGLNNLVCEGQLVRASYGTTKYCTYFLKKMQCPNLPDCYFLHCFDKDNQVEEKDSKPHKELFEQQQKIAEQIISNNCEVIEKEASSPQNSIFPTVQQILEEFVYSQEKKHNPEYLDLEKNKSEPEVADQNQQAELPDLEELQLRKTQSQVTPSIPTAENQLPLESYIHRLILSSCLKSTNLKSKFSFAKNDEGHDKQEVSRLRKYMLQHLKQH